MNTVKFFSLVFFFALSGTIDVSVAAEDRSLLENTGNVLVTNGRNWTDQKVLEVQLFNEDIQLNTPKLRSRLHSPDNTLPGSHGQIPNYRLNRIFLAGEDVFACGQELTCNPTNQYCSVMIGGPAGVPPIYSCVDVPDISRRPTCENIPDIGIGCQCAESGVGITVTCTAP